MMMWGWEGMAAWGWIFMVVFWVALIALVVAAVAALFPRGRGTGGRGAASPESPEEILDRRFAEGEIDAEAYRSMRAELTGRRTNR